MGGQVLDLVRRETLDADIGRVADDGIEAAFPFGLKWRGGGAAFSLFIFL